METGFAKIIVPNYDATWHYITEDCSLNNIHLVEKGLVWDQKVIALLTVLFTPLPSIHLKFL